MLQHNRTMFPPPLLNCIVKKYAECLVVLQPITSMAGCSALHLIHIITIETILSTLITMYKKKNNT